MTIKSPSLSATDLDALRRLLEHGVASPESVLLAAYNIGKFDGLMRMAAVSTTEIKVTQ